jgi:hypothetical protein
MQWDVKDVTATRIPPTVPSALHLTAVCRLAHATLQRIGLLPVNTLINHNIYGGRHREKVARGGEEK